jgi:hypothetical protein
MNLAEWLRMLKGIHDVMPCRVFIGKETFVGATYQVDYQYTAGMRKVQDGEAKEGETYTESRIYLLGNLPKLKRRSVFRWQGGEWFIGSYWKGPGKTEWSPYGPNFSLHLWNDVLAIDHYEKKLYNRVDMRVENL